MTHTSFVTKSMTLYFVIIAPENVTIRTDMHNCCDEEFRHKLKGVGRLCGNTFVTKSFVIKCDDTTSDVLTKHL
jgi:hypothetical protein